ncbi:MAG: HAMP domain-containing histidine kinase [Proteobacteria bacterium]|nr:HAMP domain-containing histidine kinase [Pseudomonadota bacterium]
MSVRRKLIVIILFVAIIPLAVSASAALSVHRRAVEYKLAELELGTARHGASVAQRWFDNTEHSLVAFAGQVPWSELSTQERQGALSVIYRQLTQVAVVGLLDERGQPVGNAVFARPSDEGARGHPRIDPATLDQLARRIPRLEPGQRARAGEVFLTAALPGRPHPGNGGQAAYRPPVPLLPLSIGVPGGAADWTLVVAVALDRLCNALSRVPDGEIEIALYDHLGRTLCPVEGGRPLARGPSQLDDQLAAGQRRRIRYRDARGALWLATAWPAAAGWIVVAGQPADRALAPIRALQRQTWFWIALSVLIGLSAGLYLARGITASVHRLIEGARQFGRGNLNVRLDVTGRDEMGELARTFNQMGQEIARRDEELRQWNRELEKRVDDRTLELRQAQDQLLQSRKMAAMSALAAGLAHEINNPLTGISGMAQVLKRDFAGMNGRPRKALDTIEEGARRIHSIVQILQSLSDRALDAGFVATDARDIIAGAVDTMAGDLERDHIDLIVDMPPHVLELQGNVAQLREVFTHVLRNAITASEAEGCIEVRADLLDKKLIRIEVVDAGIGIAPELLERVFEPFYTTKQDWQNRGSGLAIAHRIVENHGGSIKLHSTPGSGTTVTIVLPASVGGAHLV